MQAVLFNMNPLKVWFYNLIVRYRSVVEHELDIDPLNLWFA